MSRLSSGWVAWSLPILKASTPSSPDRHAQPRHGYPPTLNSEEPVEPVPRSTRGRRTSRSPAPRTRQQGPPGRDAGPRSTWMAVSLTPRWILPLTPPVRATNVQQPSAQQASNGHGRTVVTHTGPPVGLTGGIPKWQRLSPICPPRRARHARRAAGFWLPARSPEHQVRPAPIWGSGGAPKVPRHFPRTAHQPPATAPLWTGRSTANRLRYGGPRTRNDCVSRPYWARSE